MSGRGSRRDRERYEAAWTDFDSPDERTIRRERERARALRKTRWWQQKSAAGRCHYCSKEVGAAALTMDHLLPLSRGGRSTKENLVPCCRECNVTKRSMMPIEWDRYCDQFRES